MHIKLVTLESQFHPSELTEIVDPLFEDKHIKLWLKRDDQIHPIISGNKWRKLKYILNDVINRGCHTIVSMGGAYSNHLHALAYAGKLLELNTVGIIRGEKPKSFNETLQDLQNWGMALRFVSRTDYRALRLFKQYNSLPGIEAGHYWLPEGGAAFLALKGVAEIISEINETFDYICVPCGTGATMAGLVAAAPFKTEVIGFSALKGGGFLHEEVRQLLTATTSHDTNWRIQLDYHFGGFAKHNHELLSFIACFEKKHGIQLESVYTGKMLFGLYDLIKRDYFKPGANVLAIHTGGLQGNR